MSTTISHITVADRVSEITVLGKIITHGRYRPKSYSLSAYCAGRAKHGTRVLPAVQDFLHCTNVPTKDCSVLIATTFYKDSCCWHLDAHQRTNKATNLTQVRSLCRHNSLLLNMLQWSFIHFEIEDSSFFKARRTIWRLVRASELITGAHAL